MKPAELKQSKHRPARKAIKFLGILFSALIVALAAGLIFVKQPPSNKVDEQVSSINLSSISPISQKSDSNAVYHKKLRLYKRPVGAEDQADIRQSASTGGYQAVAAIPQGFVAAQQTFRTPQFLSSVDLSNYHALSTLATQPYYSNANVQQFLTNLSSQETLRALNLQMSADRLNSQLYLSELSLQQLQNNLKNQQYLNDLNFNQFQNNLNFQTYLSNLNSQVQQFNLSQQNYLNNFNLNNTNTFNTYTPQVQLYTPQIQIPQIQIQVPQVHFYTPPMQFYNPPPSFHNFP
jgi:hypothetical protein